jgi:hypothetical protein
MIAAPLITRPVTRHPERSATSTSPGAGSGRGVEGSPQSPLAVDTDLAEALAKVKTPADDEIAKPQQAFDRMMQLRTEQEREVNAIREFGIAQQKKENDFLMEFIRMI